MGDDVSGDIFAFIDQEKAKSQFSNETNANDQWKNQSYSTASDWLISRRDEREKIINFVHTSVWGRSPKDEDYLSEDDDLLIIEPDSPSSPSTISSASASARSSAAEEEPGPSKSLLKKVLQKAHQKRPKKKSKREKIVNNESSDSDFEIIEEKSSPKASPKPTEDSPKAQKSDRSRESTPKSENVICISDSPLSSETDNTIRKMVKKAKKKEKKRKKREKRDREKKSKSNLDQDESWEEKKRRESLTPIGPTVPTY